MPYKEEGNKKYDIARLWGRHKTMLSLFTTGLFTIAEIAEQVGYTPQTVSHIINSELGKQHIAMLEGASDSESMDLMVRIKSMAPMALAVQEGLLLDEGSSGDLKYKISDKMLDRAGYAPISKNLNVNVSTGVKKEDLDEIKKRALEIKNLSKVEEEE